MIDLDQPRTALVVGGSGALGAAVARRLADGGHRVAVHYHADKDTAHEVVDTLPTPGIAVGGDISVWDDVAAMEIAVQDALGPVEILVNTAAVRDDGLMAGQSSAQWSRVIDVNLVGAFNVIRAVLPRMIRMRRGAIVNVISPAALIGSPGQTAYSASKAGIVAMSRALAHEVGRRNITVNSVSPGFMETELTAGVVAMFKDRLLERTPLRRFTDPEEVARAITTVLALPYSTGQVINIDGGVTA